MPLEEETVHCFFTMPLVLWTNIRQVESV